MSVVLIILIIVGTDSVIKSKASKREIDAVSDSIAILKHDYSELEKRDQLSSELVEAYKFAANSYQDSLQSTRSTLITQKKRYAKQVADLSRVPTDTLYRDLTGWLDSLSIQW